MKKWVSQFKTEDWVVVAVSVLLLALAILIPNHLPKIPKNLSEPDSWQSIFVLFVIVLLTLYLGWLMLGKPLKGLVLSLAAVFCGVHPGANRRLRPASLLLRFESVFFLRYLRVAHPQPVPRAGMDETRHTERVFH